MQPLPVPRRETGRSRSLLAVRVVDKGQMRLVWLSDELVRFAAESFVMDGLLFSRAKQQRSARSSHLAFFPAEMRCLERCPLKGGADVANRHNENLQSKYS